MGTTGKPGEKTQKAIMALAKRYNIRCFSMTYAQAVAPRDPREQARIIDLLVEIRARLPD